MQSGRFVPALPWPRLVGAGLAVFLETSRAEAEGVGLTLAGGKLLDSLRCFPARHGLDVARAGVEDQPPEPPDHSPLTISSRFTGHWPLSARHSPQE